MIRVAGNVISPEVMGSIQYAGTHLGTRLIMVLGHEGCGADDRQALEQLCRYLTRPALANERVQTSAAG